MTEPRFEELINLYLDNEIGRHELGELKSAIRDNGLRRQKFERACQLHQAARKALVARKEPEPEGELDEVGSGTAPRAASSIVHRSRAFTADGKQPTLRQKQIHAHRNATVSVLAERQMNKGAASSVDLGKISLESDRTRGTSGRGETFLFFESPTGMALASVFAIVGVLGLYLLLRIGAASGEVGGAPTGSSVVNASNGPIDQKELMRELQKGRGAANSADVMHANIYQSAAGQPATSALQVDYTVTQTETASPGSVAMPNVVAANASNAAMTVQISQTTMALPGSGGVGIVNSSQLNVSLPAVGGVPGNSGNWVNMSLPPLVPPPASGNVDQSGNNPPTPVTLP